ncbi:MAG: peptide deformylase [Chloroflexi bacterium]|nr:peptide deformylase [Chloroflexota bacterium]
MTVRPIVLYPEPSLRTSINVTLAPGDPDADRVLRDLADTLDVSPGVAIAAPQIGYAVRAIIVDVSRDRRPEHRAGHGLIALLNPRLLDGHEPYRVREGCLSVPDFTGSVVRYRRVVVEGTTGDGRYRLLECEGFEALAFQHEIDHLDGRLFLDRIESPRRDLYRRKPG